MNRKIILLVALPTVALAVAAALYFWLTPGFERRLQRRLRRRRYRSLPAS
jgi:hypothetical protein